MDWLLTQAQTASPFVAVFCIIVLGTVVPVLWRRHLKDQDNHNRLSQAFLRSNVAQAKAMNAISRAIGELSGKLIALSNGNGNGRRR